MVIVGEGRTTTTRVFVFCSGDTDCGLASLRLMRVHCGPPGTRAVELGRAGTLGGTCARCIAGETMQLSDSISELKLLSFTFH